MIKRKLTKLAPFFQSVVVVFVASLFVMSIVYAATTIGSNITTDGTLNITGLTTMGRATTTSATTSAYLMVGSNFSLPSSFDYDEDLAVSGDVVIGGQATITTSLWVGTTFTVPTGFDFSNDLGVSGDLVVNANATTTGNLSVGGFASTTGYLKVGGGVIDLATGTPTTTQGVFSRDRTTSTSTVSIGDVDDGAANEIAGCLEMVKNGLYFACYIDGAGTGIICQSGRCN